MMLPTLKFKNKAKAKTKKRTPRVFWEDAVYASQQAYIRKRFGKKAADHANYGWGVDEYMVSTKVYGHGVLTSEYRRGKVYHDFE
jgi:hypothetical protein